MTEDKAPGRRDPANPYVFLAAEEAAGDYQAEEALFLSFNIDLGFLEDRLLGVCQAAGARVTAIADARLWAPDSRAIRHAGRSYHVGLVDTGGPAFHPKLTLIAGPRRATAVIGSGNLTMGGWQYNAELLVGISGDDNGMPGAFEDIVRVLESLAHGGVLDPLAQDGVRRSTRLIRSLLDRAPGIASPYRVAASWEAPLIDQLPAEPVADLLVSAPFHDPGAEAVRRLLDRLRPQRVRISVQPNWTVINPAALGNVLDRYAAENGADIEIIEDQESPTNHQSRYRHGKLIEWVTQGGERWAMTGSPNLTSAALLHEVSHGGNYELALIGPVPESLVPEGTILSLGEVPEKRIESDEVDHDVDVALPRIIAAQRTEEGFWIRLSDATPVPAAIEVSLRQASPDSWAPVGTVPREQAEAEIVQPVDGGTRVRLAWRDADGQTMWSRHTYVSDPERVRMRPVQAAKRQSYTQRSTAADLFEGTDLLNSLAADLAAFAQDVDATRGPQINREESGERANGESGPLADGAEPWLWMQDASAQRLGRGLAAYALGLPMPPVGAETAPLRWEDKLNDDSTAGLEGDTAESADAEALDQTEQVAPSPADHRDDDEWLKKRRRDWCRRATDLAGALTLDSRLLILRITLSFWSTGNWDEKDREPYRLIKALLPLLDQPETGDEIQRRIGSLAAVAMTMLRQRVDRTANDEPATIYRSLVDGYSHLLVETDDEAITEYASRLLNQHGGRLTVDDVLDTIADLTDDDFITDAIDALEAEQYEVTRLGPAYLQIEGTFSNPEPVALTAVGLVKDYVVAIRAMNDRGDWALAGWRRPDLVVVTNRGGHERWRHRRLPSSMSPTAHQILMGRPTRHDIETRPKHRPTDAAREVLAGLGVTEPSPLGHGRATEPESAAARYEDVTGDNRR